MPTQAYLLSPAGTRYELSVDNAGALLTGVVTAGTAYSIVLTSPDGTRYELSVDNAGALLTAGVSAAGEISTFSLASPGGTAYEVLVDNAGALLTQALSLGSGLLYHPDTGEVEVVDKYSPKGGRARRGGWIR